MPTMLNNASNKTLGMIFTGLLIVALVIVLSDLGNGERTFRSELVDIDSSAVSKILIYPKKLNGAPVELFKDGNNWKVKLSENKSASVPQSKINQILKQLMEIKPDRLAGRGEENWAEFEVDSSATRIELYEGSDKTLDLVIGKFTFQQPRSMKTFVRLANDTDVYETEGFLSMTFNQDANYYRDDSVIQDDVNNWKSLSFSYPADSSYQLVKANNNWQLSTGEEIDSAKTVAQLNRLSNVRSPGFVDVDKDTLPLPQYKLTIIKNDDSQIEVFGYKVDDKVIINSSQNSESFFDGSKNDLFKKVFVGSKKFIGK
jgi:hypothetical protein